MTKIRLAKRRLDRATARVNRYEQRVYSVFLSYTAYKRLKRPIPDDHVTCGLTSKWRGYVGYAPAAEGRHLLRRLEQARLVLDRRTRQRDVILAPIRQKAAARREARQCPPLSGLRRLVRPEGRSAHPEEIGFWAAIRAAPDDLLPWLVYADWLDEHGDPESAATIRRECARPQYVGTIPADLGRMDPAVPDTQRAWREALAARGKVVPPGSLVATPCRRSDRFKVTVSGL